MRRNMTQSVLSLSTFKSKLHKLLDALHSQNATTSQLVHALDTLFLCLSANLTYTIFSFIYISQRTLISIDSFHSSVWLDATM